VRSELVFSAQRKVINRFLLCRLTAISVPRMHRSSAPMSQTLNQIFSHVGLTKSSPTGEPEAARPNEEN
jgi:hypothetical protein